MGNAVHKPCVTEPVHHQDPFRQDVEDVCVVVRCPSGKRHEHVQLTLQQLVQTLCAGALLWQDDEAPPVTEEICQALGGRVVLVGSPQSHEIHFEAILLRKKLERPRDKAGQRAVLYQVVGEEPYPELRWALLRDRHLD